MKWNEVTWYSRLLAIIIFIAVLPAMAFYVGTKYQETADILSRTHSVSVTAEDFTPVTASSTDNSSVATSPSSTSTTTTASTNTVALADSGKVLNFKVGDTFLLKLGDYNWSLNISDPSVISRVPNIAVVKGAQGVYRALKAGSAEIEGTGSPICDPNQACPDYLLQFSATIKVN